MVEDGFAPVEASVAERHAHPYGAIWLGLE